MGCSTVYDRWGLQILELRGDSACWNCIVANAKWYHIDVVHFSELGNGLLASADSPSFRLQEKHVAKPVQGAHHLLIPEFSVLMQILLLVVSFRAFEFLNEVVYD